MRRFNAYLFWGRLARNTTNKTRYERNDLSICECTYDRWRTHKARYCTGLHFDVIIRYADILRDLL